MGIEDRTDKYVNGYVPTYLELAAKIGTAGRVLELGVQGGGSLELWRTLFPFGAVLGVDDAEGSTWPEGTMAVLAEQTSEAVVRAAELYGPFDLIVDDASHLGDLTDASFVNLWPHVRPGRFYVVEDWLVAFKGRAPMYDPEMLEFAASLIELVGLDDVAEIRYRPGQIIITKAA